MDHGAGRPDGATAATPRAGGSASATYHHLTSYAADRPWFVPCEDERVDQDFVPLDDDTAPDRTLTYRGQLPVESPPSDWVLPLRHALGWVRRAGAMRRAAASAGGCHPIEAYLLRPDGVWHYEPDPDGERDLMRRVGPATGGEGTAVVLTGVAWRTCWRYAERGYRHLWWDAGTVTAHLMASAPTDLTARLGFVDDDVARAVGAGVEHVPLAVLTGQPVRFTAADRSVEPEPTSARQFALVDATHQAGALADQEAVTRWARTAPAHGPRARAAAVRVAPRRITRTAVDLADLEVVVAAVAAAPPRDSGPDARGFLALVHEVRGLEPGVYEVAGRSLHRRQDWTRERSRAVLLDQQHAEDAAAVILQWARLTGDRDYRAAQFGAGYGLGVADLIAREHGMALRPATVCDDLVISELGSVLPPDAVGLLGLAVSG